MAPRVFVFLVGLLLVVANSVCAEEAVRVERGLFYSKRPFGALAWIDQVYSYDAASDAIFVKDMSRSTSQNPCYVLPRRSEYWFLISHRNVQKVGQTGYFAVRIVGHSRSRTPTEQLRIHRSPGWADDEGNVLAEFLPDPRALKMGVRKFIELHGDVSALGEKNRLKSLVDGIGVWHARPDTSLESSWRNRQIFSGYDHVSDAGDSDILIYGARLMKFAATDKTSSFVPIVFRFNALGLDSFFVSTAAPGFELDTLETEIRIDHACETTTAD